MGYGYIVQSFVSNCLCCVLYIYCCFLLIPSYCCCKLINIYSLFPHERVYQMLFWHLYFLKMFDRIIKIRMIVHLNWSIFSEFSFLYLQNKRTLWLQFTLPSTSVADLSYWFWRLTGRINILFCNANSCTCLHIRLT